MKTNTISSKFRKPILLLAFFLFTLAAEATHFRYMSVNWQITSYTATTRTVQFNITQSWRKTAYFPLATNAIGMTFNVGAFNYGDASSATVILTVTSQNNTEDRIVGTTTLT